MKYDLFRQAENNLLINDRLQTLQNDLMDLRRKAMTANRVMDGILDRRSNPQDATEEIENDINVLYSKRNVLSHRYQICSECNTKLPLLAYEEHLKICLFRSKLSAQEETKSYQDLLTEHQINFDNKAVVKSHPPRNLKVFSVDSSSITCKWDAPLFDGGAPIMDYEFVYSKRGKRMTQKCTRWCNSFPIPQNVYTIDGLEASTTYSNIKIRCKNQVGWSDFSAAIDHVQTTGPTILSPPQRFRVDKIAGTYIDLSWTPPFFMGGSKLESYELQYIEPISEEEQDVGKDSKKTRMEKRIVKIEPQKTSYRLGNLRGGHTYLNFMLTARNVHGISSIPSTCGDVCTKQSSRADDLRKELKWARSSLFNHIDSDFLTGVIQREDKQFYIQKLETELDSIAQQDNDSCRNDVYDSSNDDLGQNDGNKESEGVPTMSTRYKQFEFRINAIEESISARYQEIESTNSKRFFLSKQIKILEERANEIKTELQRISDFDDQIFVTSDVMHDSEQRFQVVDLKSSLSKELVTSSSQMETWKNEIVQGDGRIALLQEWIEESKEKLMERRAAFFLFQKKQRRSSLLEYHSNRSNEELMKLCIVSWSKIAKEGIFKTKRMAEFSYYIRLYLYRNALTKWKICTSAFKQFENTKIQTSTIVGKAGRCLLKNEIGRLDAKVSLQHTLTNLKEDSAKTIWDDLYDPKVWNEHGLFGIVLGDHYFDRDDAARAIKCYLSLPPIVESLNVEETAKMQYLNIIELKIANAARVLGSYSKATLYFESVLLRSNAMGTNRITALAHLGLGDVYMHTREYATAQDHFSLALCVSKEDEALSSLSTLTGQLLERCLLKDNRSHISDIIAPSTQDLRKTVAHEIARVDELKSRLTHAGGLRLGCITPIENAPITLVQIRMRREDIKATIQQKEDELNQIREDVEELAVLIKRIEGEISGAKTTNGRTSSLVHDNPQIFQDQELREKLSLRLSESKLKFKQFQEKQNQLTIDIKNLRDEDVELDERARIEECPLMSKVLSRRKIRLMAFDRRSGGNLVAVTIERDIYLHDLMDGKALVVFTGGESSSSSGKSIGGHTKTITTLLFYGEKIFSGSMDKSLICWSIDKKTLIFKAFGHSGTITSISIHDSLLLTGSTDKSVIIWSSHDGQILKQLRGHSRGILGLATWPSYFASADADGEIQIWNHEYSHSRRLHLVPRNRISVIRCGQQELICGDSAGFISVFWLESETIIRQSKAHASLVTDLSFDASKIVSCSTDGTVKVIDMFSCQILHTVRAGEVPIYSVYFTKTKIVFLSSDGKIQHWLWESTDEHGKDGYKYHTVTEGDTIKAICKIYQVNVRQLLKLNPDTDIRLVKVGTRLLISKPKSKNDDLKRNVRFGTRSKFRNTAAINSFEDIVPPEDDILRPNILAERTSLASRLVK